MILKLFLFLLFVLLDLSLALPLGPFIFGPKLATLYLFYLTFRQDMRVALFLLLVFVLLVHPFSATPVLMLGFSYGLVLWLLRGPVQAFFADTYLVNALWVFVFAFCLELLLGFFLQPSLSAMVFMPLAQRSLCQAAVMALLAVPLFWFLDRLHGTVQLSYRVR